MVNTHNEKPTVLVFAGHDPSGGAGLQADIEAIGNNHCRAVSVITALTAQNTGKVGSIIPQAADAFQEQAELLLEDIKVDACKIGLVTNSDIIDCIAGILEKLHPLPVVLDPVITAGTGDPLNKGNIPSLILSRLAPMSAVMTPNLDEARRLTGIQEPSETAKRLLETGCRAILITGQKIEKNNIINQLYTNSGDTFNFSWEKLPGTYHGSGCTLAASLAALLARGLDMITAVEEAQSYTWHCLRHAQQLGRNQLHPDRFFQSPGINSNR